MQLVVNDLITSYQESGKGSRVALFLHGWADNLQTFDGLVSQFVEQNPNFKAVSLDLPGFGATQPPSVSWGLEDYAQFVTAFAKKKDYDVSLLVGHSNGGAIAITMLASEQLSTDGLVLIASAGIRDSSLRKTALKSAAKPAKLALSVLPKSMGSRLRSKAYSAIGSDLLVAEHMQETFKKVVSTDVLNDAAKLQLPVCLVYGDADQATPASYGERYSKRINNSQLHVLPDAGHFVHQEQTDKVATIITEFTQKI